MEDTTNVVMAEDDTASHASITDKPDHSTISASGESDNGTKITKTTESEQSFGTDSFAYVDSNEQSVADQEKYPPSNGGKESVNMAAVSFLRAISMQCPEATLEWEAYRKGFTHKLSEASVRAAVDGCLRSQYGKDDIHAVLEAKPFSRTMNPEKALMQIGLEMLAFIVDCELGGRPRKRYEDSLRK